MAYGLLRFTVHRERAGSHSSRAATGPPSLAAAWKGMGPCGYHKPPSLVNLFSLGYFLLLFGTVLMSAEGFSQGGNCHVQGCSDDYQVALQDLDADSSGAHDNTLMCTTLRTYWLCITRTTGCQGNIMYYTLRNIVQKRMEEHNCTITGDTLDPSEVKPRPPTVPAVCMFQGKPVYRTCALFGDPHLRTFYEEVQTCKVKGAWPLVNNDYLIVQVTNDPVEGNTVATATSKLTVIVKGNPECTSKDFQTYQAQTYSLPSTFEDGRVTYGPYGSLELVEVEPGKHVEIHIRYIATLVVVRQIGRYFTFSIKMPEELVNKTGSASSASDLDLCVRGCPLSEQINFQKYLAQQKFARPSHTATSVSNNNNNNNANYRSDDGAGVEINEEDRPSTPAVSRPYAEKVCRDAKLVDFYFDSCVFDLMATGDENFTLSALSSLQDVIKLYPSVTGTMANRSSLDLYDKRYGENAASGLMCCWGHHRTYGCHHQLVVLLVFLTLLATVLSSR